MLLLLHSWRSLLEVTNPLKFKIGRKLSGRSTLQESPQKVGLSGFSQNRAMRIGLLFGFGECGYVF